MFSSRTEWDLARNRYTEVLDQQRQAGREVLDLTASNPTTIGLQYGDDHLLRALANREALRYQPTQQGLSSARAAIAEYYQEQGIRVAADDLILTTSTSEAYSFVFRLLCNPGDTVLIPAPSYPLFDFLAELNDVKLASYELVYDHGWQIDFQSLQNARRKAESQGSRCRAVMALHPNNPTGNYVKPHEAIELSSFCAANELALIVDEVFLDYSLQSPLPTSFAANAEALTFTLSGLSKISALPQMKVAWTVVSGPAAKKSEALARLEVIADTYLSMNAPVQYAIPEMLAQRHGIQQQLMQRVRTNLAVLDTELARQSLCKRLAVDGGWYVLLRVPVLGSDEDLVVAMLSATGVLLQPGHFYNFPSDGHLVASLITPSDEFSRGIAAALSFISHR